MANHLLVSTALASAAPGPPAGIVLHEIGHPDLAEVAHAYWRTYLDTPHRMSPAEADGDVRAAWDGAYGPWLAQGSLLARSDDGDVVGAILSVVDAPWPDVPRGPFVIDLFVLPTGRRRGTGRALVQAVLAAVTGTVALRVDDAATEARALYTALGFRPAP